ncbi:PA14 domain-containing protein [Nitratifractor sp.]
MRRIVLFLLLSTLIRADLAYLARSTGPSLTGSAQGFETVNNDFQQDYQRSSLPLDDALDEHVPIGFSFPFNGSSYTELIISSNGVIYFRPGGAFNNNNERSVAAHYNNRQLNTNSGSNYAMPDALFPYWDDLNPYAGGKIKYGTVGSGAGEHFVVSWEDVPHYYDSGSYSFQVALYKDGTIIYRYDKNSDADGYSATIGVKEDDTHYDEYTYNSTIDQQRDVVYRPYRHLTPITPPCSSPVPQIEMSTYQNGSNHPRDSYEFQTLRQNNTSLEGSGYQDNIDGSGNPYGSNNYYWTKFGGYIYLPDTGDYRFGVDGDDAVELYLDDRLITGWYGGHGRANQAEYVIKVYAQAGWHKINFYQEERTGADNYYLYWARPGESNLQIVPASRLFHCPLSVSKSSCVVNDLVEGTTHPKRIPGSTIRYSIEVKNPGGIAVDNAIAQDNLASQFDETTIRSLRIGTAPCDCLNPQNTSANGPNGTGDGVNPVKLDFGTVDAGATECGYFDVDLK